MPAISVQEAVRRAQEALGETPTPEMAAWITANLGLTVKPVIVTVMLGSFQEKEILEEARLKALQLMEKVKAEEAEKPKEKKAKTPCPAGGSTVQCPAAVDQTAQKPGCPACGSGDYVFRGRRFTQADPVKGIEAATETKHACRGCGNQWKVRAAGALRGHERGGPLNRPPLSPLP